jgi:lipid II:glycine glycyltransferase (peptidoglycan interpeptide bridge formation enzyme)
VWTYWNTPRPIMELDIRGTVEDILALMQRKTRYRYRTALRRGVTVTEGSSAELTQFGRLIREMGQRKKIPVRDQRHFEAILKVFGPSRAALLIARHEYRVLGGQIVVCAGRRAYALYAAVEHAGNLNPSEVLDVASIEWAKQRGCVTLHLGGTCTNWPPSPEDKGYGVYDYKRRLGAKIVLLGPYVDIAVWPTTYRLARLFEELALPLLIEKRKNKFTVLVHRFKERHFDNDQTQCSRGDA